MRANLKQSSFIFWSFIVYFSPSPPSDNSPFLYQSACVDWGGKKNKRDKPGLSCYAGQMAQDLSLRTGSTRCRTRYSPPSNGSNHCSSFLAWICGLWVDNQPHTERTRMHTNTTKLFIACSLISWQEFCASIYTYKTKLFSLNHNENTYQECSLFV